MTLTSIQNGMAVASEKLSGASIGPSVLSFVGLVGLFLLVAPLHGLLPLGTQLVTGGTYSDWGFIECLTAHATVISCPIAGLPQSYVHVSGLPVTIIASAFQRAFDTDVVTAGNLAGLVFLGVSVPSMWALLRMLGATPLWALGGTLLFYTLPIVRDTASLGSAMFGYVFLPVCAATVVLHWKLGKPFVTTGLLVAVMTVQMFLTGYVFVMAAIFGAIYGVLQVLYRWRAELRLIVFTAAGWVLSIVIALLAYKAYVPGGAAYRVMPLDFFRAQGVDLVALAARSRNMYWLDLPWGIHDLVPPVKYFAHGEALRHSYLGVGIVAGMILFLAVTRFWTRPQLLSIALAALLGFMMALGPSLKIDSQRSDTADPHAAASYLMPADAAVLELPHAFLYQLWPLNNMRSVSRWYVLFAFAGVAMATVGLSRVSGHRRRGTVVAIILVIWMAAEYAPDYRAVSAAAARAEANYARFNSDAVVELKELLEPSELVVFVGAGGLHNEYVSLYLCAMADCRTFNASGDKALEVARSGWSTPVRRALDPHTPAEERSVLLIDLLRQGVVDAVVLAHFDMLHDSDAWPPSAALTAARSMEASARYPDQSDLSIERATYFTAIHLAQQDRGSTIRVGRPRASPMRDEMAGLP